MFFLGILMVSIIIVVIIGLALIYAPKVAPSHSTYSSVSDKEELAVSNEVLLRDSADETSSSDEEIRIPSPASYGRYLVSRSVAASVLHAMDEPTAQQHQVYATSESAV